MSEDVNESRPPFRIREQIQNRAQLYPRPRNSQRTREEPHRPIFRIGGSIIHSTISEPDVRLRTVEAVKEGASYKIESPELNQAPDDRVSTGHTHYAE